MRHLLLILVISTSIFSASIEWHKDYNSALKNAQKEDKLLFVFITSKDCKFCEKLKNTTLKDKEIVNKVNQDYSSVIVMKDRDYFPKKLSAKATPMLYFLDKDENIIDYSLGYWNKVDFNFILKDVKKRLAKRKKQ